MLPSFRLTHELPARTLQRRLQVHGPDQFVQVVGMQTQDFRGGFVIVIHLVEGL
jgi:hypothetical protein